MIEIFRTWVLNNLKSAVRKAKLFHIATILSSWPKNHPLSDIELRLIFTRSLNSLKSIYYPTVSLLLGDIRDVRKCLKKLESKKGNPPSGRARRCESNGRRYKGLNSVSAHLPTHARNSGPSDDRASVSRPHPHRWPRISCGSFIRNVYLFNQSPLRARLTTYPYNIFTLSHLSQGKHPFFKHIIYERFVWNRKLYLRFRV